MRKLGFWRTFAVLAAVAVSGFAAAALAAPSASPAKLCKAERADANFASTHGGKTFAQFYGVNKNGKNAFGKCVKAKAKAKRTTPTTTTTVTTTAAPTPSPSEARASAVCKAEQSDASFATAHAGKTFAQHYGANAGQQNAFGKCVSANAMAKSSAS
jgi:hypothetical protein